MIADFYRAQPSRRSSWRMAVLMGENSRTYKFALADALLVMAGQDRTEVRLAELAVPYAMSLVRRISTGAAQSPETAAGGDADFLTVVGAEAAVSLAEGVPTERLLAAACRSMPGMVMRKFHNLTGGTEVPDRFYELADAGRDRIVRLTPALRAVAVGEQAAGLRAELDARWRIVETSFASGIGRSLVQDGLAVDTGEFVLTDRRRRRSVAGVADAG